MVALLGQVGCAASSPSGGTEPVGPEDGADAAALQNKRDARSTLPPSGDRLDAPSDKSDVGSPTEKPDAPAGASAETGGSLPGADTSPPAPPSTDFPASTLKLPVVPGGFAFWLDAREGVKQRGDKVVAWQDHSGSGNHAIQAIEKYLPEYKAAAANGLPAIHFTGKVKPTDASGTGGPYLVVKDGPGVRFGTADFSIFVVAGYSNRLDGTHLGALGAFFYKRYNDTKTPNIFFSANWMITEKTEQSWLKLVFQESAPQVLTKSFGFNDGKLRLYVAQRAGGKLQIRINGKQDGEVATNTLNVDIPGEDISIGAMIGGPRNAPESKRSLLGDMQVIAVRKGTTEAPDLAKIEQYLMTSFKIAP